MERREEHTFQILLPSLRIRIVLLVIGFCLQRCARWQRNLFMCREIVRRLPFTLHPNPHDPQVIQRQIRTRRDEPDAAARVHDATPGLEKERKEGKGLRLQSSGSEEPTLSSRVTKYETKYTDMEMSPKSESRMLESYG